MRKKKRAHVETITHVYPEAKPAIIVAMRQGQRLVGVELHAERPGESAAFYAVGRLAPGVVVRAAAGCR